MTAKARLWTGATLMIVLCFNYAMFAAPLFRRSAAIAERTKAVMAVQAKSKNLFARSDDAYMLELFRKERAQIDRSFIILNSVAATFAIIITSWTLFGLVLKRR